MKKNILMSENQLLVSDDQRGEHGDSFNGCFIFQIRAAHRRSGKGFQCSRYHIDAKMGCRSAVQEVVETFENELQPGM